MTFAPILVSVGAISLPDGCNESGPIRGRGCKNRKRGKGAPMHTVERTEFADAGASVHEWIESWGDDFPSLDPTIADDFAMGAHDIREGYMPTKRIPCKCCGVYFRVPLAVKPSTFVCSTCGDPA